MDKEAKVKPSERFVDLKRAAEALDDCKDKEDLLALFRTADGLFETVQIMLKFKPVDKEMKRDIEWLRKWRPLFAHFEVLEKKEKVVPLQRRGDRADVQG